MMYKFSRMLSRGKWEKPRELVDLQQRTCILVLFAFVYYSDDDLLVEISI